MKPDELTKLKPPEGAVRLRRFLERASRNLVIYSAPLYPLGVIAGVITGDGWIAMLVWVVPFLCMMLALTLSVARSLIPSFMRFSLGGLMVLIWSAAGCISAIVAGAQNEYGWLALLGVAGLSMWCTVVLYFVVLKEQRYEWPRD